MGINFYQPTLRNKPTFKFMEFTVDVNNHLSINALIKAGQYDDDNRERFIGKFPSYPEFSKGNVTTKLILVNFQEIVIGCYHEIMAKLKQCGLQPASIYELLSLGIQYPEEQKKGDIIAFGSTYDYLRYLLSGGRIIRWAPILKSERNKRILGFTNYLDEEYLSPCCFLAKSIS